MPKIAFTANIQRHVHCPDAEVRGETLAEALSDYFSSHPGVRGYILDDQGAVRQHMVIFVDGAPSEDRGRSGDCLRPDSEIMVFQALSGG